MFYLVTSADRRPHDFFFFFNDTATTEIYTLSLHDALPISLVAWPKSRGRRCTSARNCTAVRSEEHTSELQSPDHLVCRLLLEKKKKKRIVHRLGQVREALYYCPPTRHPASTPTAYDNPRRR